MAISTLTLNTVAPVLASLASQRVGQTITVNSPTATDAYYLVGRRPGTTEWHLLDATGVTPTATLGPVCLGLEICVERWSTTTVAVVERSQVFGPILHAVDPVGTTVTSQEQFDAAKGTASTIILSGDWSDTTLDASGVVRTSGNPLTITTSAVAPVVIRGVAVGNSTNVTLEGLDFYRSATSVFANGRTFVTADSGDRDLTIRGCDARGDIVPESLYKDSTFRVPAGRLVNVTSGTIQIGDTATGATSGATGVVNAVYAPRAGLPWTIIGFATEEDQSGWTPGETVNFTGGAVATDVHQSGSFSWLPRLFSNSDAKGIRVEGCLIESVFSIGDFGSDSSLIDNVAVGYWMDGVRAVTRATTLATDVFTHKGNVVSRVLSMWEEGYGLDPHPDALQFFSSGGSGVFYNVSVEDYVFCRGNTRHDAIAGVATLVINNSTLKQLSFRNVLAGSKGAGISTYLNDTPDAWLDRITLNGWGNNPDLRLGSDGNAVSEGREGRISNSILAGSLLSEGTDGFYITSVNNLTDNAHAAVYVNEIAANPQELLIMSRPRAGNEDKGAVVAPGYLIPAVGVRPAAPTVTLTAQVGGFDATVEAGFDVYHLRYRVAGSEDTWVRLSNDTGTFEVRDLVATETYEVSAAYDDDGLFSLYSGDQDVTTTGSQPVVGALSGVSQDLIGTQADATADSANKTQDYSGAFTGVTSGDAYVWLTGAQNGATGTQSHIVVGKNSGGTTIGATTQLVARDDNPGGRERSISIRSHVATGAEDYLRSYINQDQTARIINSFKLDAAQVTLTGATTASGTDSVTLAAVPTGAVILCIARSTGVADITWTGVTSQNEFAADLPAVAGIRWETAGGRVTTGGTIVVTAAGASDLIAVMLPPV